MNPDGHNNVEPVNGGARANSRGPLARVVRLASKELREILRDRRTIITLVLMPLLVYPLISILFQRFLFVNAKELADPTLVVGVEVSAEGDADEPLDPRKNIARETNDFFLYLVYGEMQLRADRDDPAQPAPDDHYPLIRLKDDQGREQKIEVRETRDVQRGLADGSLDLGVRVKMDDLRRMPVRDSESATGFNVMPSLEIELLYRENSPQSALALSIVKRHLQAMNERSLVARVRGPRDVPAVTSTTAVKAEDTPTVSLSTIFPLILILMTITGAVYPAIDLTAGERERGTLESLIAAPVPRMALLLAKYIAVITVALMTATVNVVAMAVTIMATGLGPLLFGEAGLSIGVVVQVFCLMILFAAFFSAVLLALTSFARSFKEAQAYLIPVMLISIAPGLLSLMPDVKLDGILVVTPLVNIVLLGRDMFDGKADGVLTVVVVLSTAFYALAAIAVAARIFGTDAILYSSHTSWSDLFRRPDSPRAAATVTSAMLCLAIMFPAFFLLANFVAQYRELPIDWRLGLNGLVTILLFSAIPLVAARLNFVPLRDGFQLRAAPLVGFLAAALLGFCLWPLAHEIFLVNEWIGVARLSDDLIESAQQLLKSLQAVSPLLILLTLAVIPAVCEEFFFRGYLMNSLLQRTSAGVAILASAILFGAFHVVATNGLAAERFLPSTFMGLVLGWVCYRTASVLPGMLLHTCHNGLLLMMAYYRDDLIERGFGLQQQSHLPVTWIAASVVLSAVGIGLIMLVTRRRESQPTDS